MHLLSKLVRQWAVTILIVAAVLIGFGVSYGSGVFSQLKVDEGGLVVEDSQSLKANKFVRDNFGGESNQVIILASSPNLSIDSPEFIKSFNATIKPFEKAGATVVSYYTTGEKTLKSSDLHSTYALVEFENKSDDEIYNFVQKQSQKRGDVTIQFGGELIASRQISHQIEQDLVKAEIIALPILLILLIVIFRSVIAAVLPVLLGIIAIIGGTSIVRLLANFVDIDQYAINVITVLGLGLSIDYSVLMVSRFREELQKYDKEEAINRTIRSSGRTILFSGLTVMICLLGLTLFPVSFLRSVGVGGVAALAIAVISALTILPSMLLLIGNNINRGRLFKKRKNSTQKTSTWLKLGNFITNHPYINIFAAVLVILVLALPLTHLTIKSFKGDYRSLPRDSSTREVAKSLNQNFKVQSPSIQIAYIHEGILNTSQGISDVYDTTSDIAKLSGISRAEGLTSNLNLNQQTYQLMYSNSKHPKQLAALEKQYLDGNTTYLKVYTDEGPSSQAAQDLVKKVRNYQPKNGYLLVGGNAAVEYDLRASVAQKAPLALGLVAVSIVVLLSLLLRSIVIPLQALLINSFSLLAAFGILVWIFQDGNLTDIGWFIQTGSLDLTILILVFIITLGISMDYSTFYYSRAREEYSRTGSNTKAILNGLVLTGPVISQAAILLFVVVIAFATSKIAFLQQVGVGLALAVLIDAFVVRIILVPAVMKITGKFNWYSPKFLKKLSIRHD